MKRRKNAKEDTVGSLKRALNPFKGIQSSLSFRDVISTHHSQDKTLTLHLILERSDVPRAHRHWRAKHTRKGSQGHH